MTGTILSAVLSAALQVLVFTAVAWAVYLVARRRNGELRARGFRRYVGLYAPERRTLLWGTAAVALAVPGLLLLFASPSLRAVATAPNTVPGRLRALGLSAASLAVMATYAFVQTALAEEILFRGLIAKRLIARLGFPLGNAAQAVVFGALHLLLFVGPGAQALTPASALPVVAVTSLLGWGLGFLNERAGNGSIVPSWWVHGVSNFVAYWVLAFRWT